VELCPVALLVTITLPLFLLWVEDLGLHVGSLFLDFGKSVVGVEESRIQVLGCLVATAYVESLGGDVTGRGRLGLFDLLEELFEDPLELLTVLGAEDLGDEVSVGREELGRELQGSQHKLVLRESILNPGSTDVGRTVVDDSVGLPCLEVATNGRAALVGGNVALEGDCFRDGLDWRKIDTNDQTLDRHGLGGDLHPRTGRGTQIDKTSRLLEEAIFLVQLDQLEGGTSAVALLFGEMVVFIQTRFRVLLVDSHVGREPRT